MADSAVVVEVTAEKPTAAGDAPAAPPAPAAGVGVLALFRFATSYDVCLIVAACVCALGHGVVMPLFSLLFGDVINGLNTTGSISA